MSTGNWGRGDPEAGMRPPEPADGAEKGQPGRVSVRRPEARKEIVDDGSGVSFGVGKTASNLAHRQDKILQSPPCRVFPMIP